MTMALPAVGWRRQRSGRARLTGLTISAPGWQADLDAWCETVGLQPPAPGEGSLARIGSTRATRMNVTLVDGSRSDGPVLSLTATTDDLDSLIERAKARGSDLLAEPSQAANGIRTAVVIGPAGIQICVEERQGRRRATTSAPWRVEDYLLLSTGTTAVVIAAAIGYFCHLAVLHAPHHQVTFGFLIAFCAVLSSLGALVSYPAGLIGGEDDHGQHTVHTLRSEVAGTDPTDRLSVPGARWQSAAQAGAAAGVVAATVLGLFSFAMLGRPVGFWLLWAWAAALGATSVAVSSVFARKRGVLIAGRRAYGLPVQSSAPSGVLGRAWFVGALPLALSSALVNAGLAWTAYRYGVSTKTLSSDIFGAVVVTGGLLYLLGRQSGRSDWRAGRILVPDRLLLPAKVRLGPQGLLYFMIAELIALNLVGHALPHPPSLAVAVVIRSITSFLAGFAGFGLGAVAGALNQAGTEADEVAGQ